MTTNPTPQGDLPELPQALGLMCGTSYNPPKEREFFGIVTGDVPAQKCDVFTAAQMREYGRACIAASQAVQSPAEPVAWFRVENGMRVYYESNCWPDLTPLYSTPTGEVRQALTDELDIAEHVVESMGRTLARIAIAAN